MLNKFYIMSSKNWEIENINCHCFQIAGEDNFYSPVSFEKLRGADTGFERVQTHSKISQHFA